MATNIKTKKIYVRLLDEGTEVFRPTEAKPLTKGYFELLPTADYDPEDEKWEFSPGSVVRTIQQIRDGENIFIAVGVNYDGGINDLDHFK